MQEKEMREELIDLYLYVVKAEGIAALYDGDTDMYQYIKNELVRIIRKSENKDVKCRRNNLPDNSKPISYKGVRYPSKTALAKALNISPGCLNYKIQTGKIVLD